MDKVYRVDPPRLLSDREIREEIDTTYKAFMKDEFQKRLGLSLEKMSERTGMPKSKLFDYAMKGTKME